MSLNLNKVIIAGRMTNDPELKQTQTGVSVVNITIAVNRRFASKNEGESGQPTADFINVVAWRQSAEFISRYFRKGSAICIVGSIQTRTWQDAQGQKRYATEVVADEVNFVESKAGDSSQAFRPESIDAPSYSSNEATAPKFEELKTDDDLPF